MVIGVRRVGERAIAVESQPTVARLSDHHRGQCIVIRIGVVGQNTGSSDVELSVLVRAVAVAGRHGRPVADHRRLTEGDQVVGRHEVFVDDVELRGRPEVELQRLREPVDRGVDGTKPAHWNLEVKEGACVRSGHHHARTGDHIRCTLPYDRCTVHALDFRSRGIGDVDDVVGFLAVHTHSRHVRSVDCKLYDPDSLVVEPAVARICRISIQTDAEEDMGAISPPEH